MSSQCLLQTQPEQRHWPGRVLVGFDGSPTAGLALEWAIREVAARGSSLSIGRTIQPTCFHRDGVRGLQEQRLARLLKELRNDHPSLVVDLTTTQGDPRQALIEEAEESDLLVLPASNGGSASAWCPVAVTHPDVRVD